MSLVPAKPLIAWIALIAAFVLLANDGRHHWHEFREIYSAGFYSNAELMSGVFDPGPSPVRAADEVATWYANKLLHIAVLRVLIDLFGGGLTALGAIQAAYTAMLVLAMVLAMTALRNMGTPVARTRLIAGLALLSPVSIYLGFKSLEQAPALLLAAAAAASFTAALNPRTRHGALLSALAGISLALSALASWTGPPVFIGLVVALVVTPLPGLDRRSICVSCVTVGLTCGAALIGGLVLLGGSVAGYAAGLVALAGFSKALPMWLFAAFNAGLFGAALWLIAPVAWLSEERTVRRRFVIWLLVAVVPVVVLAAGFLEPRYLIGAVIPLSGLGALGLEAAWGRSRRWNWPVAARGGAAAVIGLATVGAGASVQPVMPYESNQRQLVRLVRDQWASGSATILVPWNYSDFHLLRFAFPDKPIYLVQSPATADGHVVDDPVWTAQFASTYGDHFLRNGDALVSRLHNRTVLIGWTILPSLANLRELFTAVWLDEAAARIDGFNVRNHLTETWIWEDRRFAIRKVSQYGQYRLYEVRSNALPSDESAGRTEAGIAAVRRVATVSSH